MMKTHLLLIAFLVGLLALGQDISPYALVYKPSIEALKAYAKSDDEQALLQSVQHGNVPDTLWLNADSNRLPQAKGVYLLVYTAKSRLTTALVNQKPWPVYINQEKSEITVRVFNDSTRAFITNANVFVGAKGNIPYKKNKQAFVFHKQVKRWGNLLIVHNDIPIWVDWDATNNDYNTRWWYRIEYGLRDFWHMVTRNDYHRERKAYRKRYKLLQNSMSYIATNKPLYRAGDTLKLKAFLLDKRERTFNKPARVEISYFDVAKRKKVSGVLDTIQPYRAGAFKYAFVIADSLLGKQLTLSLVDKKERVLQETHVEVKDYTLNKVEFEAELLNDRDTYHPNVPMRIFYTAIDDLGLPAMEGRIYVEVNANRVLHALPEDVVILPNAILDTVFQVDATGKGIFTLPATKMPDVDMRFHLSIRYVAANGEMNEVNWHKEWYAQPKKFHLQHKKGQWIIVADSAFNFSGKQVMLEVKPERITRNLPYLQQQFNSIWKPIKLPYTLQQPIATQWHVWVDDTLALSSDEEFLPFKNNYDWQVNEKEVIYFCKKPQPQTAMLQVFADGKKLVYQGPLANDTLRLPANCRFYMIYPHMHNRWHYWSSYDLIWVKPHMKKSGTDFLQLTAEGPQRIYPGDTASWRVRLQHDDGPVEDFDLLAMAYKKKQFDNTIGDQYNAPRVINERLEYPGLKRERLPKRNNADASLDANFSSDWLTQEWLQRLGADTLQAYKYMFQENGVGVHHMALPQGINRPQFAPFVYEGGKQIAVEAFYVDSRVRYIKSITTWAYSSEVEPGLQYVVIRLVDQKITVPNVRMSQGYKTELALDLANLPDSIEVENMPTKYTDEELAHFRKYVLRFQFSGKYTLTQGNAQVVSKSQAHQNYGPFAPDKISFLGENLQLEFPFTGNQTLTIDRETRILERKPMESYNLRPGMGWRYGGGSKSQLPGALLQIPPPIKQPDYCYYEVSVVQRPSATFPNASKLSSIGYVNNKAFYFAYCANRKELYQIQPGELRGYSRSPWLPGTYQLFMVEEGKAFFSKVFTVAADQTVYIDFEQFAVAEVEPTIELLRSLTDSSAVEKARVAAINKSSFKIGETELIGGQTATIYGVIKDNYTAETVPFANITIKQNGVLVTGGTTDLDGNYTINPIMPGTYDITCSFAGYATITIADVALAAGTKRQLDFNLSEESEMLLEVVTVARAEYIETGKTSAIVTAEEIKNLPYHAEGQTAGIHQADDGDGVNMRGARGNGNQAFIDGVKVRGDINLPRDAVGGLPAQYGELTDGLIQLDAKGKAIGEADEVLNALGSRGGNVRSNFRDYAFFIPNVTTDAFGEARIKVDYPDDVANWQNYFIGMGSGGRYAFTATNTLAYSEVSAALATPRYLLKGDSCVLIGKTLNYLDTNLAITNYFTANGDTLMRKKSMLADVAVHQVPIVVADSLTSTYSLRLKNGFVDGEQRTVPVLPVGLQESKGAFWMLQGDTTVEYKMDKEALINVGIMQTTCDFLLEEVDQQLRYVHNCNEQMASKLRVILAIQEIDAAAERREHDTREAKKLIRKLLENRNEDMLWGWWSKQETNAWMSTYVIETLLKAKTVGYEVDFGNSLQEAVDILASWQSVNRVNMMHAFNSVKLDAPYQFYMEKIVFDSLSVSGKLKYALVAEQNQLAYDTAAVSDLFKKDMLGNIYVAGDGSYSLSGSMHNTLLGVIYLQLKSDEEAIKKCLNYMLLGKTRGDLNTIERAALINVLAMHTQESGQMSSLGLTWDGGQENIIDESRFINGRVAKKVTVTKRGGGVAFASATSQRFNPKPTRKTDDFLVETSWEKPPQIGEKTAINITIQPSTQARYVMLEVPIPAGCTVIERGYVPSDWGNVYQEVKGDKVYVYVNRITENFMWTIPVLPRYAGEFTMNPIKAELMYFPTKSGNDGIKRITVEQ
jgi:hypothetical protein